MKQTEQCCDAVPVTGVCVATTDVGRGIFVARDFIVGEEILVFRGPVIDFHATLAKGERECDAYQIGPDRYLDLESPGVFINHSCDPNVGVLDDIRLVALRDLRAGEEIRFDYSTSMDEDHWTLECRCGAPNCRRVVRDFKWLPKELKLDLIRRHIVPRFLVESELSSGRLTAGEISRSRLNGSADAPPDGSATAGPNGSTEAGLDGSAEVRPNGSVEARPNGNGEVRRNGRAGARRNGNGRARRR